MDEEFARARPAVFEDMSAQLHDLLYEGFMPDLELRRFRHYPRYLEAMRFRLEKLELDPARDARLMQQLAPWWRQYLEHIARGGIYDEALDDYRWLLEEYRVSLFAQHLGTAEKTSPKRLGEAWQAVLD